MANFEIEFHKVTSLPANPANYRGHVFFNDATDEPHVKEVVDGEEVERLKYERGIYLCAYDSRGNLEYIPYTTPGAGDDGVGIDVDTLNDRITLWASRLQDDIQKLAKLIVDPDAIMAQVSKFYNELSGEIATFKIETDKIKSEVKEMVDGVNTQYTKIEQTTNKIKSEVDKKLEGYSTIEQTAAMIKTEVADEVAGLEGKWSQIMQTAENITEEVRGAENRFRSKLDMTAKSITSNVENKVDNVRTVIEQLPNSIMQSVKDEFDEAYILTEINRGNTNIRIHADKILLDGEAIAKSLSVGGPATTELFDSYKNTIIGDLNTRFEDLQMQIDGTIDNWYYPHYPIGWVVSGGVHSSISENDEDLTEEAITSAFNANTAPDVQVEPYASWMKDGDDPFRHIGDTFTNTNFVRENGDIRDGRTWKFVGVGTPNRDTGKYDSYEWRVMSDAASLAMKAVIDVTKDTSNKRRIFTEQPVPPYDKGDLWVTFDTDSNGKTIGKEIFICIDSKIKDQTFEANDWIKSNNYIGPDILNATIDEAKNEMANTIAAEVKKVDLRDVLLKTGIIKLEDGSYVPTEGLIEESTDANGVTTITMRSGDDTFTWQKTAGVDDKGNEFLTVAKPWGDPSNPEKSSFVVSKDGLLEAHNAIVYGTIHASKGDIGGIEIVDNGIRSSNDKFTVNKNGKLYAAGATIEGDIIATTGHFGNIYIQGQQVYLGDTPQSSKSYFDNDGVLHAIGAKIDGDIVAKTLTIKNDRGVNEDFGSYLNGRLDTLASELQGKVDGITDDISNIDNGFLNTLKSALNGGTKVDGGLVLTDFIGVKNSSGALMAGLNGTDDWTRGDSKVRIWAGQSKGASSSTLPFCVTENGKMYATNADITGEITASKLTIKTGASVTGNIPQDNVTGLSDKILAIESNIRAAGQDASQAIRDAAAAAALAQTANSNANEALDKVESFDPGSGVELNYLTEAIKQEAAGKGLILTQMLAIEDGNDNFIAGLYGGDAILSKNNEPIRFWAGKKPLSDNIAEVPFVVDNEGDVWMSKAHIGSSEQVELGGNQWLEGVNIDKKEVKVYAKRVDNTTENTVKIEVVNNLDGILGDNNTGNFYTPDNGPVPQLVMTYGGRDYYLNPSSWISAAVLLIEIAQNPSDVNFYDFVPSTTTTPGNNGFDYTKLRSNLTQSINVPDFMSEITIPAVANSEYAGNIMTAYLMKEFMNEFKFGGGGHDGGDDSPYKSMINSIFGEEVHMWDPIEANSGSSYLYSKDYNHLFYWRFIKNPNVSIDYNSERFGASNGYSNGMVPLYTGREVGNIARNINIYDIIPRPGVDLTLVKNNYGSLLNALRLPGASDGKGIENNTHIYTCGTSGPTNGSGSKPNKVYDKDIDTTWCNNVINSRYIGTTNSAKCGISYVHNHIKNEFEQQSDNSYKYTNLYVHDLNASITSSSESLSDLGLSNMCTNLTENFEFRKDNIDNSGFVEVIYNDKNNGNSGSTLSYNNYIIYVYGIHDGMWMIHKNWTSSSETIDATPSRKPIAMFEIQKMTINNRSHDYDPLISYNTIVGGGSKNITIDGIDVYRARCFVPGLSANSALKSQWTNDYTKIVHLKDQQWSDWNVNVNSFNTGSSSFFN